MSKNILSEAQDEFYWPRHRWLETLETREIVRLAFSAGAKWATKTTSELSPHIARFIEMMILLGWFDAENVATDTHGDESGGASASDPNGARRELDRYMSEMQLDLRVPPTDARDDA